MHSALCLQNRYLEVLQGIRHSPQVFPIRYLAGSFNHVNLGSLNESDSDVVGICTILVAPLQHSPFDGTKTKGHPGLVELPSVNRGLLHRENRDASQTPRRLIRGYDRLPRSSRSGTSVSPFRPFKLQELSDRHPSLITQW